MLPHNNHEGVQTPMGKKTISMKQDHLSCFVIVSIISTHVKLHIWIKDCFQQFY